MNAITVRSQLVDYLAGKEKRGRGGEKHDLVLDAHAAGTDHVIKRAGIAADVIGGVAADQVLVVASAVEHHVARRGQLSGRGIVGGLVGVQRVGAKANYHMPSAAVDVLILLLLIGANQHFIAA